MGTTPEILGLIPARAGSKRVANKNVRELAGHPLLAYSIASALDSGVFKRVIVSTDSVEIADIARSYGAEVPFLRPEEYATDTSQDIHWLRHLLGELQAQGETAECFSILRPTSPFRKAETIRRAWAAFLADGQADSLRAVEKCAQHPAKMWTTVDTPQGQRIQPVMKNPDSSAIPWHSTPYQALPPVYVQNASMEIAWTRVVLQHGSIAGENILPFFTVDDEGYDINTPEDWVLAEYYLQSGQATLPEVKIPARS